MRPAVLLVLAAAALAAPLALERAALGDGMPPPLEQRRAGVQIDDIECREGLVAALRSTHGAACVRFETARALGWEARLASPPAPPGIFPPTPPDGLISGALFFEVPVMNGLATCSDMPYWRDTFYYGSQAGQWVYACGYDALGVRHYLADSFRGTVCTEGIIRTSNPYTGDKIRLHDGCAMLQASEPGRVKSSADELAYGAGPAEALFDPDSGLAGLAGRMRAWIAGGDLPEHHLAQRPDPLLSPTYGSYHLYVYGPDLQVSTVRVTHDGPSASAAEFLPLDDTIAVRMYRFTQDGVYLRLDINERLMQPDAWVTHATVSGVSAPVYINHGVNPPVPIPRSGESWLSLSTTFKVSDIARQNGLLISGVTDGEGGLPVVNLKDIVLEVGFSGSTVDKEGYAGRVT